MRYIKPFKEAEQPLEDWGNIQQPPAQRVIVSNAEKARITQWIENGFSIEELDKMNKDGVNLDFDNCVPLRAACHAGKIDVSKYFIDNDLVSDEIHSKNMPMCWASEFGQMKLIDFLLENGFNEKLERPMGWLQHSRRINQADKLKLIDYLQSKIDSGAASASPQEIQRIISSVRVPAGAKLPGDYYKRKIRPDRQPPQNRL